MELTVDANSLNLLYNSNYQRNYEFMSGNIPTGIEYQVTFTLIDGCDKPKDVESSELVLRFPEQTSGILAFDEMTISNPWDDVYSAATGLSNQNVCGDNQISYQFLAFGKPTTGKSKSSFPPDMLVVLN